MAAFDLRGEIECENERSHDKSWSEYYCRYRGTSAYVVNLLRLVHHIMYGLSCNLAFSQKCHTKTLVSSSRTVQQDWITRNSAQDQLRPTTSFQSSLPCTTNSSSCSLHALMRPDFSPPTSMPCGKLRATTSTQVIHILCPFNSERDASKWYRADDATQCSPATDDDNVSRRMN